MTTKKTTTRKLSTLELLDEEPRVEPFIYVSKTGEEIVFPDPLDLAPSETEQFLRDCELILEGRFVEATAMLQRWCGEHGANVILVDDKPSYRQLVAVLNMIATHYQTSLGNAGE